MPKLTDTQLMLLSKATQQDGLVAIPPNLKGAAATKVIKPLLAHGLVKEVPSTPDVAAWRRDESEGQSYALVITGEGREAINVEEAGEQPDQPTEKPARKPKRAAKPAGRKAAKRAAGDATPRAGSKIARVTEMLGAASGTTIDALVKKTGWQPHTTRAALTGLRKRGYRIEKERRPDGKTTYRIVGGGRSGKATARKGRKAR
jgi:hypothetical protein